MSNSQLEMNAFTPARKINLACKPFVNRPARDFQKDQWITGSIEKTFSKTVAFVFDCVKTIDFFSKRKNKPQKNGVAREQIKTRVASMIDELLIA